MAKRRMPPRYKSGPKKGRFMSKRARAARKGGRKRRNPGRSVQPRRNQPAPAPRRRAVARPPARRRAATRAAPRAAPRRNRYARNAPRRRMRIPRLPALMRTFTDGIVEAGQVLVGKAAVRTIPDLMPNVPKEGNMGIAIQAGTALVIGFVAEMFLTKGAARAILAGALTAPLETLIVAYQVPWISQALAPVSAQTTLQAYVRGNGGNLGAYARRPRQIAPGSSERGLGRYATERGMGYGYQ